MSESVTPEALYDQGMTYYQRREWRAALEQFRQLKALQPNWPGLDALIDEISWFLQLESVGAAPGPAGPEAEPPVAHRRRSGTRAVALAALALVVIAVGVLANRQGLLRLPGPELGTARQREALYNRGQASLAVGDYVAARQAFAELVRLAPNDPVAQAGLTRAEQLAAAAQAWKAAQEAIAAGDWAAAEVQLRAVLAVEPSRGDVNERLRYVEQQRQAAALFDAGVAAYDAGRWTEAIDALERLANMDSTYQRDAVRELLFILYLREGNRLLAAEDADVETIRQALDRFGQALALRPRNVQAVEESQLANQYLNARQALERQDWDQAQSLLGGILRQRPDYAEGRAGEQLYQLLVRRGDEARSQGQLAQAQRAYEQALALPPQTGLDRSAAEAGLQALAALITPTAGNAASTATTFVQPTPYVEVTAPTLNIRLGPGTDYPLVGQAASGDRLALVGRNEAGDWLVVCCANERPGWVAARLVTLPPGLDIALLPVGLAPTRPAPTATAAPTATHTPTVTPTAPALIAPPPAEQQPTEPPAATATPTERPR